jgi:hypothetical protein
MKMKNNMMTKKREVSEINTERTKDKARAGPLIKNKGRREK